MKKIKLLTILLVFSVTMAGCSLFTSSDNKDNNSNATQQEENNKDKAEENSKNDDVEPKKDVIAITDTLSHEDPDDIKFGAKYAYTTGKNAPEYVDNYQKYYGVDFIEQFMIIYADDNDHAIYEYDYYVFKTEKDAEEFGKAINYEASNGEIIGNVVVTKLDEKNLEALIKMDIQFGSLSDESAKGYAEFTKEVSAFMNVQ